MKVTFLGLGIMGSRMAANLLKNKVDLTIFNRSDVPLKELGLKGARVANNFNSSVEEAVAYTKWCPVNRNGRAGYQLDRIIFEYFFFTLGNFSSGVLPDKIR